MGNRRLTRLVIAITLLPLLAGCSLLDSGRVLDILGQDNAVRQQLSGLADEIRELPGIAGVESRFDPGIVTNTQSDMVEIGQIDLAVVVDGQAAEIGLSELGELVRSTLAAEPLSAYSRSLSVTDDDGLALEQSYFGMSELELELELDLEYIAAVRLVVSTPPALRLTAVGFDDSYGRVVFSADPDTTAAVLGQYPKVAALAMPSATVRWSVPGFETWGALPSPDYASLLATLARNLPLAYWLGGDAQTVGGISLWSRLTAQYAMPPGFRFAAGMNAAGEYVDVVSWEDVSDVVTRVAASGIDGVSVQYSNEVDFGAIHFGTCPNGVQSSDGDGAFIERLLADGVAVTVAVNAGSCAGAAA